MKRISILVTGATGFVGTNLVTRLLQENYIVHVVVRETSNITFLREIGRDNIRFYLWKPTHRFQEIFCEIPASEKPEIVFHLASMVIGGDFVESLEQLIQSNITFGVDLLHGMKNAGIKNFVNTGTSWQHYQNANYNPVNLYAASKQAFEDMAEYYVQAYGLRVINLHLYDNYGPGDKRKKILNLLKRAVVEHTTLDMSPGNQLIDLVYIDDVVEAYIKAGQYLWHGIYNYCGTYAVSSGEAISLRELVQILEKETGETIKINWGGRKYRTREVMVPWNNGKILPGWKPVISLNEGLRRFWYSGKE